LVKCVNEEDTRRNRDEGLFIPFFKDHSILHLRVELLRQECRGFVLRDHLHTKIVSGEDLSEGVDLLLLYERNLNAFLYLYNGQGKLVWKWRYYIMREEDWGKLE